MATVQSILSSPRETLGFAVAGGLILAWVFVTIRQKGRRQ